MASFIGMEAQEVKINGQNHINIMMLEDVTELQEVVVTGYATESRRDITGSITTVKSPKIKQTIAATPVIRTTNVEFTLDNPYTIKTGGESQTVDMIEYEVDAHYQYYSAPKFDTDAFLTARMTDWDSYNFLEGQAEASSSKANTSAKPFSIHATPATPLRSRSAATRMLL